MAAQGKRGGNRERKMSLAAHLVELRKRLFRAALGVLVGAVVGFIFSPWVLEQISGPITEIASTRNATLNFSQVTSSFDLRMQIAIYVGLFLSSPIWLYQIFAFLVPGLTKKERGYTFGFVFTAIPLFLAGCLAGWFVLPHIVVLLSSFAPDGSTSIMDAKDYLNFVLKLVLAVGTAFVLPVFLVILNFMGILAAKSILRGWRVAILLITLFTAIATPAADVFSMFLLAIPMVALYFIAVGIAYWHDKLVARKQNRLEADLGSSSSL